MVSTFKSRTSSYPLQRLSQMLACREDHLSPHRFPEDTKPEVLQAFTLARNFLEQVSYYGKLECIDRSIFADVLVARTEAHYHILNLSSSALHSALLLLSDMVVFPLPRQASYRQRLVRQLRTQILELAKDREDPLLWLWLFMMGGMNSAGPTRTWYVYQAAKVCFEQRLSTLSSVKVSMSSLLWHDDAFLRPPATAFWWSYAEQWGWPRKPSEWRYRGLWRYTTPSRSQLF